jgi:M6 family metalloprotease-like protein/uncharacterized repeat protein (TIGR02543 family)
MFILFLTGCVFEQPVKIDFNSMGGSRVDRIYVHDEPITPPIPIKEGYQFEGWYVDQDFSRPFTFSTIPEESLTLYAKWGLNTYTVEFYDYNGFLIGKADVEHGQNVTAPESPSREGYSFEGWSKNLTGITSDFKTHALYRSNETGIVEANKELLRVDLDENMQTAVQGMIDFYDYDPFYVLPSTDEVNLLVVPIEFTNDRFSAKELKQIEEAFFAPSANYETLQSYYLKSSYGQLKLDGEVLPPYLAKNIYSYYDRFISYQNENATGVDLLIEEVMAYYMDNPLDLDLTRYDSEGDGVIDGIHFIYSAPIDDSIESIYWAFQYYYTPTTGQRMVDYQTWDEYAIDSYIFSSVDFLNENGRNAWTIIHETGHLLGLEDYYDYTEDDSNKGGLGGADVMDDTMGAHNPFSKLLLDWIDPIVVEQSLTLTIDAFEESGDAIILTDQFSSLFDDYFILSYYTPTGMNKYNRYLTEAGLLIYDVNAELPSDYNDLDEYSYYFAYNNSTTQKKLIQIVEADQNNSIEKSLMATNTDLLNEGKSLDVILPNQQTCTITVNEITPSSITLTFDFK